MRSPTYLMRQCEFNSSSKMLQASPAAFAIHALWKQVASVKNRLIAGFLVGAMIMNSLAPKAVTFLLDNEEFAKIIASQSVLTEFFYHSTLPLKIMNKYLLDLTDGSGKQAPLPAKPGNDTPNTSADMALLSPAAPSLSRVGGCSPASGNGTVAGLISTVYFNSEILSTVASGGVFIFLIIVMFFFLLARSSVGEDGIIKFRNAGNTIPGLRNLRSGIFLSSIQNEYFIKLSGRQV